MKGFFPEVFPSPRVVLVGPTDKEDVDDQIDAHNDGKDDEVVFGLGHISGLEGPQQLGSPRVIKDPGSDLEKSKEEPEEKHSCPNLAANSTHPQLDCLLFHIVLLFMIVYICGKEVSETTSVFCFFLFLWLLHNC